MKDKSNIQTILKEWGDFYRPLIEGTRVYDSGKSFPCNQKIDRNSLENNYNGELDLYLRLSFSPPADGIPPDIFAETPPVLELALQVRVEKATKLLKEILERHGGLEIQSKNDPAKAIRLIFQELLLPSPPEPGDYHW